MVLKIIIIGTSYHLGGGEEGSEMIHPPLMAVRLVADL